MNCPKCNAPPYSWVGQIHKNFLKPFKCPHCGSMLILQKPTRKQAIIGAVILGFLATPITKLVERYFDIEISFGYLLIALVLVVIIVDYVVWTKGKLKEVEESNTPAP